MFLKLVPSLGFAEEIIVPEPSLPAVRWTPDPPEPMTIDPSCNEKMIFDYKQKQSCLRSANSNDCASLALNTFVAGYVATGKLSGISPPLQDIVSSESYPRATAMLESVRMRTIDIDRMIQRQVDEATRIHNQVIALIEKDQPGQPGRPYDPRKPRNPEIPATPPRKGIPADRWSTKEYLLYREYFAKIMDASPLLDSEAKEFFKRTSDINFVKDPKKLPAHWKKEAGGALSARHLEDAFRNRTDATYDRFTDQILEKNKKRLELLDDDTIRVPEERIAQLEQDIFELRRQQTDYVNRLSPAKRELVLLADALKQASFEMRGVSSPTGLARNYVEFSKRAIEKLQVDDYKNRREKNEDERVKKQKEMLEAAEKAELKRIEQSLRPKIAASGLVDVALSLSHLTDNFTISKCAKVFKLTETEQSYLKAGLLTYAKVSNEDGLLASCDSVMVSNPGRVFAEMQKKFGGIPQGTCQVLKQSKARLDDEARGLGQIPRACGGTAKTENWTLQKSEKGYDLRVKYQNKNGTHEIVLPSLMMKSMSTTQYGREREDLLDNNQTTLGDLLELSAEMDKWYPYFNFNDVQIGKRSSDTKFEFNQSASLAMKTFYRQFHPTNSPDLRPDLIDSSVNCRKVDQSPNSYKEELQIFCKVKPYINQAKTVLSKGTIDKTCENDSPTSGLPSPANDERTKK